MKNLIYQVKVGNPPPFYDVCIDSVATYCKKYGIDHIVQTEPLLKIVPKASKRPPEALKLGYLPIYEKEAAFAYLQTYDNVAIIDADIFIRDCAPNVFDQMVNCEFAAVAERDEPLTEDYVANILKYSQRQYSSLTDVDWKWSPTHGAEFYNMGMMVLSKDVSKYLNNETPEQFIKRPEFERFVNGEGMWRLSTDQTLLNYWVKKSGIKTKNLSWQWNVLYNGVQPEYLKDGYFIHFFRANNLPQRGAEIPRIIESFGT